MWKQISKWRRRARFQRQQSNIDRCGLYVVDRFALALPSIGTSVTFPEEPALQALSADVYDKEALGAIIIAALDYAASEKKQAISDHYSRVQAEFLDGMDRYRQSIKVGKRGFESQMELINISRKAGEIFFDKTNRAHGRFAFEGTKSEDDPLLVSATASNFEIGEIALAICKGTSKDA